VPEEYRSWIAGKTVSASLIDRFLDPSRNNASQFDPDTGYTSRACVLRDGIDNTLTWTSFGPGGERRIGGGLDARCRITAYGNSFTQCAQVSDGETWEEYLAAHLREPIRNLGVSGQGVWQAYLRLCMREERGEARRTCSSTSGGTTTTAASCLGAGSSGTGGWWTRSTRTPSASHPGVISPWIRLRSPSPSDPTSARPLRPCTTSATAISCSRTSSRA